MLLQRPGADCRSYLSGRSYIGRVFTFLQGQTRKPGKPVRILVKVMRYANGSKGTHQITPKTSGSKLALSPARIKI